MGSARRETAAASAPARAAVVGFTDVLRVRAFLVVFLAETQSIVGDQLARVALSILVFRETDSVVAAASTYAATLLPAMLGGTVLARVGDRFPRLWVMIACDVVRAAIFAVMAVTGIPLPVVSALLVVAVFLGPAFASSEVSFLAGVLDPEKFRAATGLRMISGQLAQVGGFALGGVLVAVLDPRGVLLLDAVTYTFSALLIGVLVRESDGRRSTRLEQSRDEVAYRGLWRNRQLRGLVTLSTLAAFFVVPEGLAVPYAQRLHWSTAVTGLLLAAIPLGGAVGAVLLVRVRPPARRPPIAAAMAIGCGLPLIGTALAPPWPVIAACWFVSGALAAYQVEVISAVVQGIPDRFRARSMGVVGSLLVGAQGVGLLLFGLIATFTGVAGSIALAGGSGSVSAAWCAANPLRGWVRARRDGPIAPTTADRADGSPSRQSPGPAADQRPRPTPRAGDAVRDASSTPGSPAVR